ncbi:hypothetical protein EVAR_50359_1 [Eumeta japonica]|uniref:Uncharacterized protein n=1 Tax=Eumeta variegata TaxID=151549 RepID=A0A4C1XZS3_EUMVA|nr:hypothetical protein EVAR_50359_1 [Eumeta japonica]
MLYYHLFIQCSRKNSSDTTEKTRLLASDCARRGEAPPSYLTVEKFGSATHPALSPDFAPCYFIIFEIKKIHCAAVGPAAAAGARSDRPAGGDGRKLHLKRNRAELLNRLPV